MTFVNDLRKFSNKVSSHQIAAFTQVARERSFSKAAKKLNITQSAVTQHISNLEKVIGTRLFIRRRSGLELTTTAREIFNISDRIHVLEQLLDERIQDYSQLDAGQINIIANAPSPALGLISKFQEIYPRVQVNFSLGIWAETMEQLKERKIDVGVVTEPEDIEGLHKIEIERTKYVALMLKDHNLAKKRSISLKDLSSERIILPAKGSLTRKVFTNKMKELNLSARSITTVTTFPLTKEAVLHDIGIGIILENAFSPSNQLKSIPIRDFNQIFRNFIVCPTDKKDLRLVRSFLELAL